MKRFAFLLLFAAILLVGWDGYRQDEWTRHTAAIGFLVLAMVALSLLGPARRRRRRSPEVASTQVSIQWAPGPLELGHPVPLKLSVTAPRDLVLDRVELELVNRRFEKKAPLDRVVSQSTFRFRFNVGVDVKKGEASTVELPMRTLSCREPTRESKYVSITWEIVPVLFFAPGRGEKARYVYEGTPVAIEFTGPQGY